MSRTPSAPCPNCRAVNFTHRNVCWKCARTLPSYFKLEGSRPYSPAQPIAESTSSAEIVNRPIAEKTSTRGRTAARAEFRELVRGLLDKCGIF